MNFCPPGTFVYSVRFGDTLWKLADRYNTTVEDIIEINPGIDPDNLAVGQQLCIPLVEDKIDVYDELDPVISLNNELRMLWREHGTWTERVIVSLVYDLPILQVAIERLLRNPMDFAELFNVYYGRDFAELFKTLLTEHLQIAAELVKAAKANDNQKFTELNRDWFQNADNIARLLSENNPFWNQDEWRDLLYTHLEMVKNIATNLLTGSFSDFPNLIDEYEMQILAMADYMLEGIMRQFPEDFDDEDNFVDFEE